MDNKRKIKRRSACAIYGPRPLTGRVPCSFYTLPAIMSAILAAHLAETISKKARSLQNSEGTNSAEDNVGDF